MKINFNKQYTTIAIYALLVILCGILCVFTFTHFSDVWAKIVNFIDIFMPIFYGMAIAYLIYPIVRFFEKRVFRKLNEQKRYGLARVLSIVIVFLMAIVSIVLFFWLVLPHIIEGYVDLQERSNVYIMDMRDWLFDIAGSTGELSPYTTKALEYFVDMLENLYDYIIGLFPDIPTLVPILINFITNFFLGIVMSIYFLLAKEKLHAQIKKTMRAFLNAKRYRFVFRSIRLADKNFGGYIKGQIADSLIMGITSYFCLMLIGVPFFPLISTIVGVANLIPVVGSLVGTVVGALIIFLANPPAVIWFVIFMIVLYQINIRMIRPYMIRVGVDASTMFMFAAIVIMTGLIGFWGLVIGVPVFVILYTILHSEVDKRLQMKGLPVDQIDYYETQAGRELYREREYRRKRRDRAFKKEEVEEEKEDFIVVKTEQASVESDEKSSEKTVSE